MDFTSLAFILFLLVSVTVYWLLPDLAKKGWLLLANLVFYSLFAWWAPLFIVGFSLAIYFAARKVQRTPNRRLPLLLTVIGLTVALFFVLRYSDLINNLLSSLTLSGSNRIRLIFPLGFSYYLFKSLGYLIDVYRQSLEAETRYLHLLLYLSYFPELPLGPITRASEFLPQLDRKKAFESQEFSAGFFLIVWGFFKKLIFADRLALLIAPFYNQVHALTSGTGWFLISFAYFIQLYLDFSGYTDISVGISKLLGYRVGHNFKAPLIADSMSEYWRRWHRSLYLWFSDYLFKPLQFSWRRLGRFASALAAFVTLTVSGIWHEARPGFMIWGVLMGLFVALEALFSRQRKSWKKRLPAWLFQGIGITTMLLINTLVLAFTRASSAGDAFFILGRIFSFSELRVDLPEGFGMALAMGVAVTALSHVLEWKEPVLVDGLAGIPLAVRWGILQLLLVAIILFSSSGTDLVGGFIYARF